jgi:acyl-CoA thioesterase
MADPHPLSTLLAGFELRPTPGGRLVGENTTPGAGEHAVVFGGQILGQTIVAATADQPDKDVKTIHTIFARAAGAALPLEFEVDRTHAGRSFGSVTVTAWQGDRLCARSLVLLSAVETDLIRHATTPPDGPGPEGVRIRDSEFEGYQYGFVGDPDLYDPHAVGPAALDIWVRFAGAPDGEAINQALLAYASDGFLIATAMRPHEGVTQNQAHASLSTGVISHTMTFHEPIRAAEWMLMAQVSPYAGRGRSFGTAHVYSQDGSLLATFVQDAMIRAMQEGRASVL